MAGIAQPSCAGGATPVSQWSFWFGGTVRSSSAPEPLGDAPAVVGRPDDRADDARLPAVPAAPLCGRRQSRTPEPLAPKPRPGAGQLLNTEPLPPEPRAAQAPRPTLRSVGGTGFGVQ